MKVTELMSTDVVTGKLDDSLKTAERLMRSAQVRCFPVVDDDGKLYGIISLGDIAAHAHRPRVLADGLACESTAKTLAAISQPASERADLTTQSISHHAAASA